MIRKLEEIEQAFNSASGGVLRRPSGSRWVAGVEKAAKDAGFDVTVPFTSGWRRHQDQTDVESFAYLEPRGDGFRNFVGKENPAVRVPAVRPGQPAGAVGSRAGRADRRPARDRCQPRSHHS